jgi:hypothetical protein
VRLARQRKIHGLQRNKVWYVNENALQHYIAFSALERATRSKLTREKRKTEQGTLVGAQAKTASVPQEHTIHVLLFFTLLALLSISIFSFSLSNREYTLAQIDFTEGALIPQFDVERQTAAITNTRSLPVPEMIFPDDAARNNSRVP